MPHPRVHQEFLPSLLLAVLLSGAAQAQPLPADAPGDRALAAKELAKVCREAARTKASELARERVAAARKALRERHEEFVAGRGGLDVLFDAARAWLDSERAAQDSPAARVAVLHLFWRLLWGWERLLREGHAAGRVKTADYLETRARRLEAEMRLTRAGRAKGREAMDPAFDLFPETAWTSDPLSARELAKDKDSARRTTLPQVTRQWAATAREAVEAGRQEPPPGVDTLKGPLDILLEAVAPWAEAEQAARDSPAARAAALETLWRVAWVADNLTRAGYDAGRVKTADYLETRARRLEAEMRLARLRGGRGREAPALDLFPEDPLDTKELAQARDAARRAALPDLARERAAASWGALQERHQEFLAGRGMLKLLLEVAASWVEAEQAARDRPAARVDALDSLWRMAWEWERLARRGHDAGRVRTVDYLTCKGFRLEVQGRLVRARARSER